MADHGNHFVIFASNPHDNPQDPNSPIVAILECECGRTIEGPSWEAAGQRMDTHIRECNQAERAQAAIDAIKSCSPEELRAALGVRSET